MVGASGVGTAGTGLAFGASDTLYMKASSAFYTVDPVTGAATGPSFLSGSGASPQNALEFDPNSSLLYSINGSGSGGGRTSFLSTIDLIGGTWTIVGDMGVLNMSAIAVDQGAPPAVPEPSSLLILSIGAAALVAVRRRTNRRRKSMQPIE